MDIRSSDSLIHRLTFRDIAISMDTKFNLYRIHSRNVSESDAEPEKRDCVAHIAVSDALDEGDHYTDIRKGQTNYRGLV